MAESSADFAGSFDFTSLLSGRHAVVTHACQLTKDTKTPSMPSPFRFRQQPDARTSAFNLERRCNEEEAYLLYDSNAGRDVEADAGLP